VQTIRALIEGFLRGRYGYEGNQAYGALVGLLLIGALAVAVLRSTGPLLGVGTLVLGLLALRAPRLAGILLIGSILLIAWVLFGPQQQAAY
jgi:hypothetical protein